MKYPSITLTKYIFVKYRYVINLIHNLITYNTYFYYIIKYLQYSYYFIISFTQHYLSMLYINHV
jgi:hypothetical protein